MICLGALTSIANAVQQRPEIKAGIERIVWYNSSIHPNSGTNYKIDEKSANYILGSEIRLDMVSNYIGNIIGFTEKMLKAIAAVQTPYAQKIAISHSADDVLQRIRTNHLKLWDDLVALYLSCPQIFETNTFKNYPNQRICTISEASNVEQKIVEILSPKNAETGIVFKQLPDNGSFYRDDVNRERRQIIDKHMAGKSGG